MAPCRSGHRLQSTNDELYFGERTDDDNTTRSGLRDVYSVQSTSIKSILGSLLEYIALLHGNGNFITSYSVCRLLLDACVVCLHYLILLFSSGRPSHNTCPKR